jgi:hypothetical protein
MSSERRCRVSMCPSCACHLFDTASQTQRPAVQPPCSSTAAVVRARSLGSACADPRSCTRPTAAAMWRQAGLALTRRLPCRRGGAARAPLLARARRCSVDADRCVRAIERCRRCCAPRCSSASRAQRLCCGRRWSETRAPGCARTRRALPKAAARVRSTQTQRSDARSLKRAPSPGGKARRDEDEDAPAPAAAAAGPPFDIKRVKRRALAGRLHAPHAALAQPSLTTQPPRAANSTLRWTRSSASWASCAPAAPALVRWPGSAAASPGGVASRCRPRRLTASRAPRQAWWTTSSCPRTARRPRWGRWAR